MSSKARLVITAIVVEKRPVAQVVRDYDVSRSWVDELLARYRAEGEAAFEPRSRRPQTWLAAQPEQPATIPALQALLEAFMQIYNQPCPHADSHDRVRTDKIDKTGCVTLRVAGQLRHISIGRPHTGTHVHLLVHDLHVRVVNTATGELLRDLQIDPARDYQPRGRDTPT